MAKNHVTNFTMGMPKGMNRMEPFPLDMSSVYTSKAAMEAYAKDSAIAYVGQILSLLNYAEDGVTVTGVTVYSIQDTAGTLQEVGTATLGDNKTIVLDDGVLSLKDFGIRYYKYYAAVEADEEAGIEAKDAYYELTEGWIDGLEPKVKEATDGSFELAWYEPNPTTVEGLSKEITTIKENINTLDDTTDNLTSKVNTLIGTDANKSVRTIANEELVAQLISEDAAENLNSLQEIADWIQSHPDDASAMNTAITALQAIVAGIGGEEDDYATVVEYVDAAIEALKIGDYAKASELTALSNTITAIKDGTAIDSFADVEKAVSDAVTEANNNTEERLGDIGDSTVKEYVDQAESDAVTTAGTNTDTKIASHYTTTVQPAIENAVKEHADNTDIHITAEERTKWNTAAEKADTNEEAISEINDSLSNKVDKVENYGLAALDYDIENTVGITTNIDGVTHKELFYNVDQINAKNEILINGITNIEERISILNNLPDSAQYDNSYIQYYEISGNPLLSLELNYLTSPGIYKSSYSQSTEGSDYYLIVSYNPDTRIASQTLFIEDGIYERRIVEVQDRNSVWSSWTKLATSEDVEANTTAIAEILDPVTGIENTLRDEISVVGGRVHNLENSQIGQNEILETTLKFKGSYIDDNDLYWGSYEKYDVINWNGEKTYYINNIVADDLQLTQCGPDEWYVKLSNAKQFLNIGDTIYIQGPTNIEKTITYFTNENYPAFTGALPFEQENITSIYARQTLEINPGDNLIYLGNGWDKFAANLISSTDENKVKINSDNTMEVNTLNVSKLVQTISEETGKPVEELIFECGDSGVPTNI